MDSCDQVAAVCVRVQVSPESLEDFGIQIVEVRIVNQIKIESRVRSPAGQRCQGDFQMQFSADRVDTVDRTGQLIRRWHEPARWSGLDRVGILRQTRMAAPDVINRLRSMKESF